MFDRENAIGIVLLATSAIAGGVLAWSALTGTELVYAGPGWLPPVLTVAYLAAIAWMWFRRPRNR